MKPANDNLPRTPEALVSFQSGDRLHTSRTLRPRAYGSVAVRWAIVIIVISAACLAAVRVFG